MPQTDDGLYPSMPYVADPSRLSPRGANRLLQPGGPKKFEYARTHPEQPKRHFDFGKLVHLHVLGEGDQVARIDAENYTTKAARQQRDDAYAQGLIPALTHEVNSAAAMASVVHAHPRAARLLAHGDPETWIYATDRITKQRIRLRVDWITHTDGRLHIIEYKTCSTADPESFGRFAFKFGYHLAAAFGVEAIAALDVAADPVHIIIAQEKEPPYMTSVLELDAEALAVGRRQMSRAIEIFKECSATDTWPGYSTEITPISLPLWASEEEMVI